MRSPSSATFSYWIRPRTPSGAFFFLFQRALAGLADDISGRRYSKAEHRRALLPLLNDRSEGSVEFKHQNISAVLKGLGEERIAKHQGTDACSPCCEP